jgi:hypothetical protein
MTKMILKAMLLGFAAFAVHTPARAVVMHVAFAGEAQRGIGLLAGNDLSLYGGQTVTGSFSFDTSIFTQVKIQKYDDPQSFSAFEAISLSPGDLNFSISVGGNAYFYEASYAGITLEVDHPLGLYGPSRNTFAINFAGVYSNPDLGAFASWSAGVADSNIGWTQYASDPDDLSSISFNKPEIAQAGESVFGFTLGSLVYTPTSLSVSPVPEPETYALMLAGLALVGAAAKRKAK